MKKISDLAQLMMIHDMLQVTIRQLPHMGHIHEAAPGSMAHAVARSCMRVGSGHVGVAAGSGQ